MYYHASQQGDIKVLEPRISNHGVPLINFSKKRENVLVYLSNAVEKYCKETGFKYDGIWKKWGPYGFLKDGKQQLQEYYPDALEKTYKGASGYIYKASHIENSGFEVEIPEAATSSFAVTVEGIEFVPDAYEAILQAEKDGVISILRYNDISEKMKEWISKTVREEYALSAEHPEYIHFLKGIFRDIILE